MCRIVTPVRAPTGVGLQLRQLVQTVERSGLVALGQGRIVEYGLDKIVDGSLQDEDRLSDVKKLGGAFADDVDAQDFFGLPVEDELQAAGGVSADLTAGDLAVVPDADLVRHVLVRQLLFGLSQERDLGNGVHAERIVGGIRVD